mgnify:CR=1 FL=1
MQIVKHMNNESGNQDTIEKTVKMKYVDMDQPRNSNTADTLMPLIENPNKMRKSNSVNKLATIQ